MAIWTQSLFLIFLAFIPLSKTFCKDLSFQSNDPFIEKEIINEKEKLFFNQLEKECVVGIFSNNDFPSIGRLEKLVVNGNEIKADLVVSDPEEPTKQMAIAAPIEYISWDSECPHQTIYLTCRISPQFKSSLLEVLCDSKNNPKVEAQWSIYEYDYSKKKYFRSFHTGDKTILLTLPNGINKINISERFERDTMPISFRINMLLAPEDKKQQLFFSFQADGKTFSLPISSDDRERGSLN